MCLMNVFYMNKLLAKLRRKISMLAFKYRLGKQDWSAKILFYIMGLFDNFGEYSNTKEIGKAHHYVPQFILRRFRIAETGSDKGQTWEFSFNEPDIKKNGIATVASLEDFYLFKDKSGSKSDFVEKKLYSENLEYFSNLVIKRLNTTNGEPDLTFLEESTLSVFVANQLTRVPAFYRAIEKYIVYAHENKKLEITDLGTHKSMFEKIVLNGIGISLDDILKHESNLRISGANNHIGSLSRNIAHHISKIIYRRNLSIIDVPTSMNDRFVISDNPVVLLDFKRMEILQYPEWWNIDNDNLWIFMPISPTRCILLTKSKRKDSAVEKENTDLVQLVNFGQYLNATKSVFSNDHSYLSAHLKMYAKELLKIKRWQLNVL